MLKDVSGHVLEIGDKVKMNIEVLKNGDLDGVEFTSTGENYWKYICSHPDEVYTVTDITYQYSDESIYVLDGYLADNTWAADELIYVPEAKTRYEVIKNMSFEEMRDGLRELLAQYDPAKDDFAQWLDTI